ncbi:unnamed protein product [Ascophyllum nodosum]
MCQASAWPQTAENLRNLPRPTTYPAPPLLPPPPHERRDHLEAGEWGRRKVGENSPLLEDFPSRHSSRIKDARSAASVEELEREVDARPGLLDSEDVASRGGVNGLSYPAPDEISQQLQLELEESAFAEATRKSKARAGRSDGGLKEGVEAPELGNLKVAELKEMLRDRGLKVSGRKAELVVRLQEHQDSGIETKSPAKVDQPRESLLASDGSFVGQGEDLLVAPDTHRSYSDRVNGFSMTSSTALMEAEAEEVFPWRGVLDEEDEGGFEPVYPRDTSGPAMVDRGIAELQLPTVKAVGDRVEGVQMVADRENARKVVKILMDNPDLFYACDTEVADIDLQRHGPVGNGRVTCISIYGGPELDCGEGSGKILWVDNLGEADGTLEEFLPFFASNKHKKVWHNYGFDRHVLFNKPDNRREQSIDCKGFGGDTMHMARLWDTSMEKRFGEKGFSLEAISAKLLGEEYRKASMKELFGVPKLKMDGTPGSLKVLPAIDHIQTNPEMRLEFIKYSAYDAQVTWLVHRALREKLRAMDWKDGMSMLDFYTMYYVPFGELLTDMERTGIFVAAKDYLRDVEVQARKDKKAAEETFIAWVMKMQPSAEGINPSSSSQIQTLLFGGAQNAKTGEILPSRRVFKVERDEAEIEASRKGEIEDEFSSFTAPMLKERLKKMGLKTTGKKTDLLARVRGEEKPQVGSEFKDMSSVDLQHACQARGLNSDGTKAQLVRKLTEDTLMQLELQNQYRDGANDKTRGAGGSPQRKLGKFRDLAISSLGMKPKKFTAAGAPSVTIDVLKDLTGSPLDDPPKYGTAFSHFGGGAHGKEACEALYALCSMGSVDTMVSNFLQPLQELVDDQSRVHCSLNINTETGRLSARKPNLQNQPALEKDQYKIRAAFRAEEGNSLVVADYGQLELRLLAHITDCKSMIAAFKEGGCFHSRTAMGMFDHVREAVDRGEVLLEWDYSKGSPPKPLVKEVFASERRKAKTLNFSIAYGKTAHGLSKDWGVSLNEAEKLLKAWYADRPEVEKWQKKVIANAKKTGFTRTLMGRYRELPDIVSSERGRVGHGARAAINTPIQGGAADVAMMAMIKLVRSPLLQEMGWKLLLQVHDEVILEGPDETAEEALAETVRCMEQPWDDIGLKGLRVDLAVDAKSAKTWYDAK